MENSDRQQQLRWYLALRLATFAIVAAIVLWSGLSDGLEAFVGLYVILTAAATALVAGRKDKRWPLLTAGIVALQFVAEVCVDSGVIYTTGTANSPFSALFILTIVSAALAYRLVGTLVVASLASLAYTLLVWVGGGAPGAPASGLGSLKSVFSAGDQVFYSVFLHILIYYLIAFVSGFLAQRLREQNIRLADTSRALMKAKLETDDILTHLNSGLLTIDATGQIIFFNRAAERILGYCEIEIKGRHCQDVFAERMPRMAQVLLDGLTDKTSYPRLELDILMAEGYRVPLGLSTSCLTRPDGMVRGVIAIFSDLTDAKQLELKMRSADRLAAVGELSASIAHEIRNPLAAISGSVQVLRTELSPHDANVALMDLIIRESDRLSKITTEFLQYAKIDQPTPTKVELSHLINDVIQVIGHHAAKKALHRIVLDTEEAIVYVVADEDLVKQMLINLAVNALEALGDGEGQLAFRLAVDHHAAKAVLLVEDSGSGISAEAMKSIFQPFFSTKRQGTGLGLAIVDRVANALKLSFQVDSEVGVGTVFRLEFELYRPISTALPDNAEAATVIRQPSTS